MIKMQFNLKLITMHKYIYIFVCIGVQGLGFANHIYKLRFFVGF